MSVLPVDGTWPSGTTAYEKRRISDHVAQWDPQACIQCGNCAFVCPHAVIRSKFYDRSVLDQAPAHFQSAPLNAAGLPDSRFTLQVYAEDCTGCGLCVEACPVTAVPGTEHRAINLVEADTALASGPENVALLRDDRRSTAATGVDLGTVRGDAVPGTAVRVLRGLRGLRRDAVPQAAHPAVR